MKSREVNRIVEVLEKTMVEGEDLESVDLALWEQLEVYSEDAELEGFGVDIWEDVAEVAGLDLLLALALVPLRRLSRKRK